MSTLKPPSGHCLTAGRRFALSATISLLTLISRSRECIRNRVKRRTVRPSLPDDQGLLICHVTNDEVDAHYARQLTLAPNVVLETALSIARTPSKASTFIYDIDQMFPDERSAVLWHLVNGWAKFPSAVYSRNLTECQIAKLRSHAVTVGTSLDQGLLQVLLANARSLRAAS